MITFKQLFSLFLSGCLIYSQVLFNLAYAEGIVTDGSTQTTLDKARNGVPVVNIAKPSSKGLSHNKFRKYNVGKQGVILNNSGNTCVKTQLGGHIFGNKHLAGGSAKVILNEVTGSSRSHLRGYTEVAGQKADLVLVNPNGISLNGAGFINVPTITFATGQVSVNSGAIDAFSVNQGDVVVEGDGLNTQTQRATYIYAKTLQLNAKLHAQDLNVALGSNEIDYATKQVTAQTEKSKATADAVLLDSSALGGMYAGRITLVGTDKGVGVNLPPEVLASNGEITITADGRIQLQDLAAQTDLTVTSASDTIELQGTTHSGDTTRLTAGNELAITETAIVASEQGIELSVGAPLVNRGTLLAGMTAKGAANHTGTIRVKDTELINRGTIATGTLVSSTLTNESEISAREIGTTTLTNNNRITSQDNLTIHADSLVNRAGISAANTLTTVTTQLDNYKTLFSGGDMNLYATGTLKNHQDATIFALENMGLGGDETGAKSSQIINDRGTIEAYNGNVTIKSGRLDNLADEPVKTSSRSINSNGSSTITTDTERFTYKPAPAKILSGHNLTIDADTIINNYSLIAANNDVHALTSKLTNTSAEARQFTKVRTETEEIFCFREGCEIDINVVITDSSKVIDRVNSTFQAGGDISVEGDVIANGSKKTGVPLAGSAMQTGDFPDTDPNIHLPQGVHGLFIRSGDPDSNYLIETNPEFALYENFISSDYMMKQLNIDPAATNKRIGDAFYENKLVRDAVFEQTGRRFLTKDLKTDYDQFKYLMKNALNASRDLDLVAGISLSREQINSLTSDIVWMEERVVQGHRVLVPVVYLAGNSNVRLANGANIIAGKNVELQVTDLINSGQLEAGETIDIHATDAISNLGGSIEAQHDINLQAQNNIQNSSGLIQAKNVAIASDEGSFIHETSATTTTYNPLKQQATTIGDQAILTATNQLTIETGKDITIKGADVNAQDGVFKATDVNIETIQDNRFLTIGNTTTSSTTHQGSNLNVTDLNINAEQTVRISGSKIKAKEMAVSAGTIAIETVQNKTYNRKGGRKFRSTTHLGSALETTNLELKASERINIAGSAVTAQDKLKIQAGQIDIQAVNDTTHYEKTSSSKGLFSSKSSSKKRFTSKNKASTLSARTMELVTTGSDITITGSDLNAREELTLESAKDIAILAGYDGYFYEKKTREGGFFRGGQLYSEEENLEGKLTKTAVASRLSGGHVTLKSNRELLLEGSDLSGGSIRGEAQRITIKAAENEEKTWSRHVSKSIGLGDLKDSLLQPHKAGKFEDKKLTLKIADAQYEEADTSTKKTTVTGSNLTGDTIRLTAASEQEDQGNILVEGSNLTATESISLTASNDVVIKEAKETTETKTASKKGTAELTANVKHQAVEVIKAAEALQQAIKAAQQAKDAYDDYKDQKKEAEQKYKAGLIAKEDLDDIRDDERFYAASVTLTAASVVSATKNLTAQAIAATQSASTYGFNADIQLDIDAVVEKAKDISTRSVGSNLAANTIEIKAGNKALVQGSNLNATEQIAIEANEVELAASRDTSESSSSKDHAHFTYTYSAHGGPMANASTDFSESQNKTATYNNSRLNSNTISITSRQDTYVTGAVVKAEETLELDVGGDLTVASLQDRSRSKSNSVGASVGSGSASANASLSKGKRQWVTEQTALEGGQVTIDVEGHTELKGARIAAVDAKGKDTGQLSFSTDTLSYDDIRDRDANSNLSISGGTDGFGSAGLGVSDSTQLTKATIGQGAIRVGDETNPDLNGLNRDVDQSVVGVKNTGVQLDMDAGTLDVVTSPYDTVESIVNDTKQIGVLAKTAKKMVDVTLENGGSLKEGADAIAMGFNAVNNPSRHARNDTPLAQALKQLNDIKDLTPEQVEATYNILFNEMLKTGLVLKPGDQPGTMQLVSTQGLNSEKLKAHYRDFRAATDEKSLKSFAFIDADKNNISSGANAYLIATAESVRQDYARGAQNEVEDGTRNREFEAAVERVAAESAQEAWTMFSKEKVADQSQVEAWAEKHQASGAFKTGTVELNNANHEHVIALCKRHGDCDTYEENRRYQKEFSKVRNLLIGDDVEAVGRKTSGVISGVKAAYDEDRLISTAYQNTKQFGSDIVMGFVTGGKNIVEFVTSDNALETIKDTASGTWQDWRSRDRENYVRVLEPEEAARKEAIDRYKTNKEMSALFLGGAASNVVKLSKAKKILPGAPKKKVQKVQIEETLSLTNQQNKKLKKFNKPGKVPGTETVYVEELGNQVIFTKKVLGKIPGSKKVYQKVVNENGETTTFLKTTIDPEGNVPHVKDGLNEDKIIYTDIRTKK